jgi:hypothetical protein
MGDVHYIVDKLNEPPFNTGVDLISFRQGTSAPVNYNCMRQMMMP